jgi:hypothetical protein
MLRRFTWLGATLCLLASACQSRKEAEPEEKAIARFTDLIEKRIVVNDREEAEEILTQCFVIGASSSHYEALLKAATWHNKRMMNGKKVDEYDWDIAIGSDGTALIVWIDEASGRVIGRYTEALWS